MTGASWSYSPSAFLSAASVPQPCGHRVPQSARDGRTKLCATSWTYWFCGVTTPEHGNEAELWPHNPHGRETQASGSIYHTQEGQEKAPC